MEEQEREQISFTMNEARQRVEEREGDTYGDE